MRNEPKKDEKGNYLFPCSVAIGEMVNFKIPQSNIDTKAFVRAIIFTNCKVRFSIFLKDINTTLHNIDSVFVEKIEGNTEYFDFEDDNYS